MKQQQTEDKSKIKKNLYHKRFTNFLMKEGKEKTQSQIHCPFCGRSEGKRQRVKRRDPSHNKIEKIHETIIIE